MPRNGTVAHIRGDREDLRYLVEKDPASPTWRITMQMLIVWSKSTAPTEDKIISILLKQLLILLGPGGTENLTGDTKWPCVYNCTLLAGLFQFYQIMNSAKNQLSKRWKWSTQIGPGRPRAWSAAWADNSELLSPTTVVLAILLYFAPETSWKKWKSLSIPFITSYTHSWTNQVYCYTEKERMCMYGASQWESIRKNLL